MDVLMTFLKAHILIMGLLGVSFAIESTTELKLFIKQFDWRKSPQNAEIHLDRDSVYYVLINLGVYIYDIVLKNIVLNLTSAGLWLALLVFLTILFRRLYSRHQGVDPTKADDDYT